MESQIRSRLVPLTRVALLIAAIAVPLAADSPKVTTRFKSPDAAQASFTGKKVAALVITSDINLQMSAEEALVRELEKRDIRGIATYRLLPREEMVSAERARPWFERAGVDGVVSIRPVSVDVDRTYVPSLWVTSNYSTMWGYYGYGWASVSSVGEIRTDTTLVAETLVHSVTRDTLLWAGLSITENPKPAPQFITQLVEASIKELRKQKIVK